MFLIKNHECEKEAFFKCERKKLSPRIPYSAKLCFRNAGEILRWRKPKKFVVSRPALLKTKKNAKGSSSDRKEMTTEGNLEHEEWERAERAWQFSMAVNVDSLKQHTWIRSLGWLSWTLCFKLSAGCNQVPVGLCSFLDLGAFFQTHMVVGRIQFLAVIGLRPSAPTGCPLLPATWPSTGSSYDSSLSYKGSWD